MTYEDESIADFMGRTTREQAEAIGIYMALTEHLIFYLKEYHIPISDDIVQLKVRINKLLNR